jgi:hypothetical protein
MSTMAIADEFPDMGVVSPLTLGGTAAEAFGRGTG